MSMQLKDKAGRTFEDAFALCNYPDWDGYGADPVAREDVEYAAAFWAHTNGEFDRYALFTAIGEAIFIISLGTELTTTVEGLAIEAAPCADIEFHAEGVIELFTVEGTTGDHVVFDKETVTNNPQVIVERIRKLVCEITQ